MGAEMEGFPRWVRMASEARPEPDERASIRVLIVDDIERTREYVARVLSYEDDIEVVGSAADGEEAIQQTRLLQPDIVLLDLMMVGLHGLDAAPLILDAHPDARIIVMTVQGDRDYLRRAVLAGAYEYLVKPFSSDELTGAIRSVVGRAARPRPPVPSPPPSRPKDTPPTTQAVTGAQGVLPTAEGTGGSRPSDLGVARAGASEPWRRREDEKLYHYFPPVENAVDGPAPASLALCGVERADHERVRPRSAIAGLAESRKGIRDCGSCSIALAWLREESGGEAAISDLELPVTVPVSWLRARRAAATPRTASIGPEQRKRAAEERERRSGLDWSFADGLTIAYGRSVVADAAWIVLPRAWLEELVALRRLEGRTWAWAAERLSRARLEDLLERRVRYDLEEDGVTPLPIDAVPPDYRFGSLGFDDDWPETPDRLLDRWAHEHEAFGEYVSEWNDFWGATYGTVAADLLSAFLDDLRAAGASCRKDERLVRAAYSG